MPARHINMTPNRRYFLANMKRRSKSDISVWNGLSGEFNDARMVRI